jgi:Protein of unknown function (DUF3617)
MKLHTALFAAALAATAVSASAQNMKPGLWEVNNKMGGSPEMDQAMARMQAQMASMPPAQRKMMEETLAKQGVGLTGAAGGGMLIKACVTKEMADRSQMPVQQQGNCTTTITEKTSNGMKMKFVCTKPESNGEGVFTFAGDNAYTMKMKINSAAQGKPQSTTIDASGKWLGADCGNIKPVALPPAAAK